VRRRSQETGVRKNIEKDVLAKAAKSAKKFGWEFLEKPR